MSDLAGRAADSIRASFESYIDRFHGITRRATGRFELRDWHGAHDDTLARLDVYGETLDALEAATRELLGEQATDRATWRAIKLAYAERIAGRDDWELAETYHNSLTRRLFTTVGVDAEIEFIASDFDSHVDAPGPDVVRVTERPESTESLVAQLLRECRFHVIFADETRDVRLTAADIDAGLEELGSAGPIDRVEVAVSLFYRGKGAYLVGRIVAGDTVMPFALAMHHGPHGVSVGAVLLNEDDLSVLFSYTQSAFHVEVSRPGELIRFLSTVLPRKRLSEMYNAIGFNKHAKTELYRHLMRHVGSTRQRFEVAPGIAGLVMIVFTIPDYDVVFKVIRDRFPFPKQTTRRQIMAKYRLVFRHDRAGRLIDAQEFEHLRFPKERFDPALLDELAREAAKSVEIGDHDVIVHHAYIERKVIPLDLYVRQSNPIKARAAVLDYGRAIKNLAASNIFPGDMLLKNFGVTRSGRVVFYDYDELMLLTDCRFREIPDSDDPGDVMSADPWFGVGENDIFPEEFRRFMGIQDDLREAFEERHGDLFGVRFWQRVQDRLRTGEVIEIFPYRRNRRLRSGSTASLR